MQLALRVRVFPRSSPRATSPREPGLAGKGIGTGTGTGNGNGNGVRDSLSDSPLPSQRTTQAGPAATRSSSRAAHTSQKALSDGKKRGATQSKIKAKKLVDCGRFQPRRVAYAKAATGWVLGQGIAKRRGGKRWEWERRRSGLKVPPSPSPLASHSGQRKPPSAPSAAVEYVYPT